MKDKNKKSILPIIYILTVAAVIISTISLISVITDAQTDDLQWKCNIAECTEYEELSGEAWAQESCRVTEEGTVCESINEAGEPITFYLEEILQNTNLSDISATRCVNYVCIEEIPYKETNYTLEMNATN